MSASQLPQGGGGTLTGSYVAADGITTYHVGTIAPVSPATGDVWVDSDATSTLEHTHTASGAWTAYTPTWTAQTTPPVIGNGTLRGAYRQDGKTLFIRFELIVGSSTTIGSGEYRFSLPAGYSAKSGMAQAIAVQGLDRGNLMRSGSALIGQRDADYTTIYTSFVIAEAAGGGYWSNGTPMTWADRDRFAAAGVIEID